VYSIKFTKEAEDTFDSITSQLNERFSTKTVLKFQEELEKVLKNISLSPLIFPIVDERTEVRKCVIHKQCSMFYRVYEEEIIVICFWDNRQSSIW